MGEYEVEIATRYLRRQFQKGVGDSIVKVITELATNSDDSYNALGATDVRTITIQFERKSRSFSVTDQAEGLDEDDMVEHFVTYGEESASRKGIKTRSLFGKGLRDVLFTQDHGQVKAIKNGKAFISRFRWRSKGGKDRPFVEVRKGPEVTPELRASWDIPENGTRVEFKLRSGMPVPQFDKLAEKLSGFYMLRPIMSNHLRAVTFVAKRGAEVQESRPLSYSPPAAESTTSLAAKDWEWKLPERTVHVRGELFAFKDDLVQGEAGYEDREGGLLVLDENDAVLDLTLCGFDTDPAASRFFGTLRVEGLGRVIRDRLNDDVPQEILTETRDGFDRKNDVYRELASQVDSWLRPFVEDERKRRAGEAEGLSPRTRKRHDEAFDKLNDLYRKLLGETSGLGVGTTTRHLRTDEALEFRWTTLLIQSGSSMTPQLLVNTKRIAPGELIHLESSDEAVVYAIESDVPVPEPTPENSTVVIGVKVDTVSAGSAVVTATWGSEQSSIECSVVDEDVPDLSSGLAFHPDTFSVPDGGRSRTKLFADLRAVSDIESMELTSDNSSIEVAMSGSWEPITANVVRNTLSVTGHGKGEQAVLTAKSGSTEAIAIVDVHARKAKPREGGHFRGYKFQVLEARKVQALTDSERFIIINLADPTNRMYFGGSPEGAVQRLESAPSSQTLLADLVLGECLQQAVQAAYAKGRLPTRLDTISDIQSYVAEQRFEIGAEIHRLFVGRSVAVAKT